MQELEIALGHLVCSELGSNELQAADAEALLWELNRILPLLCCSRASAKGAQRVLLPLPVQLSLLSHVLLCCSVLPQGKLTPCPVVALATVATQASVEASKQHNLASSITGVASLLDTVAVPILCMWGSAAPVANAAAAASNTVAAQQAALRQEAAAFVQDLWCNAKVCSSPAIAARGALQVMSFLANLNRAECAEAHAVAFAAPDEYPSAFNRYAAVLKPHSTVIEVSGGAAAGQAADDTSGASSGSLVSYVPTPPQSAQSAAFQGLASAVEALTAQSTQSSAAAAVSHPFQLGMAVLTRAAGGADLHDTLGAAAKHLRLSTAQAGVAAIAQLNAYILQEAGPSFSEYAAGIDARTCAGVQLLLCAAPWLAPAAACRKLDEASSAPAPAPSDATKGSKKRKSKKSKASTASAATAATPVQLARVFAEARTAMLAGANRELVVQQCQSVLQIIAQLHSAGAVREDKDRAPFPLFSCLRFVTEGVVQQLQALQAHQALATSITSVLHNSRSIMQHKLPSLLALAATCAGDAEVHACEAVATALTTAGSDRQLPVVAFTAATSCVSAAAGVLPAFGQAFAVHSKGAQGAGAAALGLLRQPQAAAALVDTSLNMPNGQVVPFASLLGSLVAACASSACGGLDAVQTAFVRGAAPVLFAGDDAGDKQAPVLAALKQTVSVLAAAGSGAGKAPKTPKSAKKRRRDSAPAPVAAATHTAGALDVASRMFVAQVSTIRVTRSNFPSVAALANCTAQVVAGLLSGDTTDAAFSSGVQLLVCVQNMVAALAAYVPELAPTAAAWDAQWDACGWMACIPAAVQAALGLLDGAAQGKSLMEVSFASVCARLSSMPAAPGALRALLQRAVFAAAAFQLGGDERAKAVAAQAGQVCLQEPSQQSEGDICVLLSHLPVLEWACGSDSVQQWCAALHEAAAAQSPLLAMLSSEFTKEQSQRAPAVTAALFAACTSQAARSVARSGKAAKKQSGARSSSCAALGESLSSMQAVKAAMPAAVSCEGASTALALAQALEQCAACLSAEECARAVAVCLSIGCGSDACLKLISSTPQAVRALAGMAQGDQKWLLAAVCGEGSASAVGIQLAAQALAAGDAVPALPSTVDMADASALQWLQLAAAAAAGARSADKTVAAATVPLVQSMGVRIAAQGARGAAMAALQQAALLASATLDAELLRAVCVACTTESISQTVSLAVFRAAVSAEQATFLEAAVELWASHTAHAGNNNLLSSLEGASGKTLAWLVAAACGLLAKAGSGGSKHGALLLLQACLQHPAAFDSAEVGQSAQVLVPQIPILLDQCDAASAEGGAEAAVLLSAATAITAAPSMVALTARDVTAILISATAFVAASSAAAPALALQVFTLLNQVAKHHKRVITAILPVACALLVRGLSAIKAAQAGAAAGLSNMLYRCCVQLVRSARPAAVRHHAPQLVAAFVIAAAAQRHSTSGEAAPSAESVSADKAVLEGMYRIFDTMSASEFQHVFSAVAEYPGARQVLKTARKQWTSEHRYTGQ